jgi:hypothetical protein
MGGNLRCYGIILVHASLRDILLCGDSPKYIQLGIPSPGGEVLDLTWINHSQDEIDEPWKP